MAEKETKTDFNIETALYTNGNALILFSADGPGGKFEVELTIEESQRLGHLLLRAPAIAETEAATVRVLQSVGWDVEKAARVVRTVQIERDGEDRPAKTNGN